MYYFGSLIEVQVCIRPAKDLKASTSTNFNVWNCWSFFHFQFVQICDFNLFVSHLPNISPEFSSSSSSPHSLGLSRSDSCAWDDSKDTAKHQTQRGTQVMRNDVGVNGGIAQIIPEPSYIIQISFFFTPSPSLLFYLLSLLCPLALSLARFSVETALISIPLCSGDIAAPPRGLRWDWNEDQVTCHSKEGQAAENLSMYSCMWL